LQRYAAYCRNDVELTYALFAAMATDFPVIELKLIDLTVRMFTEPTLELVKSRLDSHLSDVKARKERFLAGADCDKDTLMSNPKLANLLIHFGAVPPKKISATTGKETWAFGKNDEEFKALLEHEKPAVQTVIAARLGIKSTLEETRTERFIGIATRGTLPIPLRYYAAHTGRWGGDDKVNMQNLPRSSPLKKAIMAPQGYVLLDSDSSQIEARTLAWLAEQNDLVDAFERGEDVYRIMAAKIYGKAPGDVTKDERFVGKQPSLALATGWVPVSLRCNC
jgi:DNA polymerase